jgi:hypothetical protein
MQLVVYNLNSKQKAVITQEIIKVLLSHRDIDSIFLP